MPDANALRMSAEVAPQELGEGGTARSPSPSWKESAATGTASLGTVGWGAGMGAQRLPAHQPLFLPEGSLRSTCSTFWAHRRLAPR